MQTGRSASDFRPFGEQQRVFDDYAEIPDRVLDLGVPKEDLNGSDITSCAIDHRRFRTPKRVGSVFSASQADRCYTLINEPGLLPGT